MCSTSIRVLPSVCKADCSSRELTQRHISNCCTSMMTTTPTRDFEIYRLAGRLGACLALPRRWTCLMSIPIVIIVILRIHSTIFETRCARVPTRLRLSRIWRWMRHRSPGLWRWHRSRLWRWHRSGLWRWHRSRLWRWHWIGRWSRQRVVPIGAPLIKLSYVVNVAHMFRTNVSLAFAGG
jgi:hypothetical protein